MLTADTFGTAEKELAGLPCCVHVLRAVPVDVQKEQFVAALGPERVIAYGNGNNDRLMLQLARLGVAVMLAEGCAAEALAAADLIVRDIEEGLDLLVEPLRLKATLRY